MINPCGQARMFVLPARTHAPAGCTSLDIQDSPLFVRLVVFGRPTGVRGQSPGCSPLLSGAAAVSAGVSGSTTRLLPPLPPPLCRRLCAAASVPLPVGSIPQERPACTPHAHPSPTGQGHSIFVWKRPRSMPSATNDPGSAPSGAAVGAVREPPLQWQARIE